MAVRGYGHRRVAVGVRFDLQLRRFELGRWTFDGGQRRRRLCKLTGSLALLFVEDYRVLLVLRPRVQHRQLVCIALLLVRLKDCN